MSFIDPIEHIWDELGRHVHKRQLQNLQELGTALLEEWQNIFHRTICLRAAINANDGHTRYS